MKYVILLMMITLAFGQDITSTQQYESLINKADAELQNAQKLRDAKVRRATVFYIKALEKKKKTIMAKGDLERANELDKEIKNLKPLLVKTVKPEKPIINTDITTTANREKALGYKLKRHSVGATRGSSGHFFKYVEGNISWLKASHIAKDMGGYLAVVNNQYEHDLISDMIARKKVKGEHVWLGGTIKDKKIKWMTGEQDNIQLPRMQLSNAYNYMSISFGKLLRGSKPTGLNGSGKKTNNGYVIEWDN